MADAGERIGFIGAGRVAQTLAAALHRAGHHVAAVSSRRPEGLSALRTRVPGAAAATDAQDVVDGCTLVFLTVSDDAIAAVCRSLTWRPGMHAVHCSGATPLDALAHAAGGGAATGGFHPLQMFANPDVALAGLPGCAVGIEADPAFRERLASLARDIGCVPFAIPPGQRALYHASANYVGPFLIALLQEATTVWRGFGVDEAQALRALLPLLRGTLAAVVDGGLARGMGGCVARGDVGTVRAHLAALDRADPDAGRCIANSPAAPSRSASNGAPCRPTGLEKSPRRSGGRRAASTARNQPTATLPSTSCSVDTDVAPVDAVAGYRRQRQTTSPSSIALPISAPPPAPMIVPSVFHPPGAMMLPSTPPATPPTTSPVVPLSRWQ